MAKKIIRTVTEEEPEEKATPQQELTPEEKFFQAMHGTGKVYVYRMSPEGKRLKVGSYEKSDFMADPDFIARKYGGGQFFIQIRDDQGNFTDQFYHDWDEIAWPVPSSDPGPMFAPAPEAVSPIEIMREMRADSDKSIERTMTIMTAMMTNFAQAFGARQSEKSKVDELKELMGLVNMGQKPDGSIEKFIEALKLGMEMGSEAPAGGEGFLSMIGKKLVNDGLLEKLAGALKPNGNAAPISRPALEVIAPAQEIKTEVSNVPKPEYYDHDLVKIYRPLVLSWAQARVTPDILAGQIADAIPDDAAIENKILAILNRPDFVDYIASYEPQLRNYGPWLLSVRDKIREILTAPAEPEEAVSVAQ